MIQESKQTFHFSRQIDVEAFLDILEGGSEILQMKLKVKSDSESEKNEPG